jgi:hypothetical protein
MKRAAPHTVSLLLLLLAAAAFAACVAPAASARQPREATLAEYRERVREARDAVGEAADHAEENDDEMEAEDLAVAREALPRSERVGRAGPPVETDNVWLHDALDEYERTAREKNARDRAGALRAVAARLRALDARLAEAGAPAPPRDREAEKGRLNTILRRPEYASPEQRENALQRQLRDLFNWLRDLFPKTGPMAPGTLGGLSVAAQYFIFTLAGLILLYVFWQLWRRRDRGPKSLSLDGARVVLGERLEADQTAADLLAEAERLARQGQLRAAIRKAYVALLCELGDRKVIGLAQHKTNRDYLQSVRQRAPRLYPEMLPLTFDFELHWYGAHAASESDWSSFRDRCRSALRAI